MKTLIITEKPSVARDFADSLSSNKYKIEDGHIELDQFVITWAIGHLLTPYDPEDYDSVLKKWSMDTLPVIPIEFFYKSLPKTKSQLISIKKLFKRSDINRLIVATDAGREGELIARLILKEVKNKLPALRFFTSDALTKEVILKELKNAKPLKEFDRLYIAGSARQKADWVVGMNLSRAATIKLGDLFSVGRVQTAVLEMIVERKKEIEDFIPKDYFELKGKFKTNESLIEAYWHDKNIKDKELSKKKDKKEDFDKIIEKIKNKTATVTKKEETEKESYPEGLYSLTELQRRANSEYGFSASKTLDLAQTLYEKHKVLSYPRTDSKVMGTSSFDLVKGLVFKFKEIYPEYYSKFAGYKVSLKNKAVFDDSKLTDHHGLIPLKEYKGNPHSDEGKIYYLVLKRFISNFLLNHKYLLIDLELTVENELFKTQAKKILEMGFKSLEDRDQIVDTNVIENIKLNDQLKIDGLLLEAKKTRPPFHYTESSLLYDMTNPARLVDENEYKTIFRTEVGLGTQATRANIIETLIKRNYIGRHGKNLIATDKGVELILKLKSMQTSKSIASVKETAKWELALQDMAEGKINDEAFLNSVYDFVTEAVLEWKKETAVKKEIPTNAKFKKKYPTEIAKCPSCHKRIMDYPKSYSCEGYKDGCKFTIWKYISGAKISESEAKNIIAKKKSRLIKSFKSKQGKPFSAYLVLTIDGKIEFQFETRS